MAQQKSITKNSIYYLLHNILNVVFPLITGIYVAHVVLPDRIGDVVSAQNIAQYFVLLSFLGIPTYGMREISKVRDDKKALGKLYSELMVINSISTLFFAICYYAIILLIPHYSENISVYAITGIGIIFNFINNTWLYEGLEEFKFTSIRSIVMKVLSFVALIIFVRGPEDYLIYAFISVMGVAGNYIFNIAYSHKICRFSIKELDLKRHLKPVLFLFVVNIAIELYTLVDTTMLSFMAPSANVAYYSYGHKIFNIFKSITNSFTMVIVPRLVYCYGKDNNIQFNRLLSKTLCIICWIAFPLIIGIQFVAGSVVTFIYGDVFINSAYVLRIVSLLLLVSPVGYLLGSRVLLVSNNESKMIICVGIGCIVNIIGNAVLIPRFQEYGAAIASVLSEIVVMIIYLSYGKRYFKLMNVNNTIKKIVVSVIAMSIYLLIIKYAVPDSIGILKTIIEIIGAVPIYAVLLIVQKEDITLGYYTKIKKILLK